MENNGFNQILSLSDQLKSSGKEVYPEDISPETAMCVQEQLACDFSLTDSWDHCFDMTAVSTCAPAAWPHTCHLS